MRGTTCGTGTESKLKRANQVLGVRTKCWHITAKTAIEVHGIWYAVLIFKKNTIGLKDIICPADIHNLCQPYKQDYVCLYFPTGWFIFCKTPKIWIESLLLSKLVLIQDIIFVLIQ